MAGKEFTYKVRHIRLGARAGRHVESGRLLEGKKETVPPCGHYLYCKETHKRGIYMGQNNISELLDF